MPDNSTKFNPNLNLEIPKWINEKYFEKILQKDMPQFKKILKFTPTAATPPGENYTSIMVRIHMDIEMKDGFTQQQSYIMKTMLDKDKGGTFINTLNLFPKEKFMYEQLLPQLETLYNDINKKVKLAPKCVWVEEKAERITLVLEDLNTKKFKNINRLKGFDMAHMKRVLEKLAEFHAVTVIWQQRNGAYPEEFQKSYLPANYQKSKSYQARVQSFKAAMSTWGLEDYEKYAERIPNAEQFVNAAMGCFNTDPNEFKVLNHGDFWSSNIMQNYTSTGEINQIRFIDFQLCKWGSPAQDLWEVIMCSSESNLRIREFDNFVRIYHTHLLKCLRLLQSTKPLPKLRELHISMLKHGFWGLFSLFKLSASYADGSTSPKTVADIALDDAVKLKVLNSFIRLTPELALHQAKESAYRYKEKKSFSSVDGITIAVKDNFCVKNVKTTCASKMLEDFVAPYNATVYERLSKAGAVLIGKTNMDQFAMGSGTVDSVYGPTKNVWSEDLTENNWRISGGSSGGSASAVAAGICYA
ncbi:uncharacterized protein LOC119682694 [Teleopsis dalmanni]|uniref:uncharacterized protein LOC119682694 n=1 Tax=Teleopsis dalmanni TaxID=139649 RepID=UPI0018CEE999|nr:uncharacterized protein LOC119682694 [Teleopsis dalmanni]